MSANGKAPRRPPQRLRLHFAGRLVLALLLLLLAYGTFVAFSFSRAAAEREAVVLQQVSRGLAAHIVERWPDRAGPGAAREARAAVLAMLAGVNPGVQVYLLDATGTVTDYLGEPGMVRVHRVALEPINAFLRGDALPLRGTDPMGSDAGRLFSVAPFPQAAAAPAGSPAQAYLYVVLDSAARQQARIATGWSDLARSALGSVLLGLVLAGGAGAVAVWRLVRPLRRLAARMQAQGLAPAGATSTSAPAPAASADPAPAADELTRLEQGFDQMLVRLDEQARRERDTLAGLAHDLRTPLTALHGHLEALASDGVPAVEQRRGAIATAALAQSNKVRLLSQQLFELATLQATTEVPQRERFRLDELVADAVDKFQLVLPHAGESPVELAGTAPGALEVVGDLHLLERALGNLIDNARRHGHGPTPVKVSLHAARGRAEVIVEDSGPGLPAAVSEQLARGESVRRSASGRSFGGLGLAIVQRVALLHGGSLQPLPAPAGGTRLCLVLPLAR